MKLQLSEEKILQSQALREQWIKEKTEEACAKARTDTKDALEALRRKKRLEIEQQYFDGVLQTIPSQRHLLENAESHTGILEAIKAAAKTIKLANIDFDPDDYHDLGENLAEDSQEVNSEIDYSEIKEFDLLAELGTINELPLASSFNVSGESKD
uniref:Type III secretion system protein n=1 Tax=Panagrolaimus davidi TaxID=227884 RepID=A0A914QY94_9BILA